MTIKKAQLRPLVTLSANTSWYLFNFRASTIRRLLADGYRVVCLSPEDAYCKRLLELGCEWLPLQMDNQGSNPIRDALLVLQLRRIYRRLRPVAALHFTLKNNVYGTWAAQSVNVPAINNISGLGTAFIRSGLVSALVRLLYQTSQPFASWVFCQNEEDQQLLVDKKLVPAEKLTLLPGSGVDLARFHPNLRESRPSSPSDVCRPEIQAETRPFRFLFAGRMLADKGLYELIEAMRRLQAESCEVVLWLCGFADVENVSSVREDELQEWAREPFVEWRGPSDAIEQEMAQVDCLVLPSYREGLPRSLLEAGAMGLPVIATDVPGCRHVVKDMINGLLCEPQDVQSLRAAMVRMLHMPEEERELLGKNGRQLVEESFSEDVVVEETLAAIHRVQSGR